MGMSKAEDNNTFNLGDLVHIKSYGRAIISQGLQEDPSQPFHKRIQVQYPDGKTYWARPSVLRRIVMPEKRIVTAETTRQYREASLRYVSPDDTVLEVGCHEGVTTAMLHERMTAGSGSIVGVDMSQITIDMARSKYPQVRFEAVDGANIEALKCLSQTGEYDRILLDIGGIAELTAVMNLVGLYYRTWRKATIIVKSVFFARLLGDAEVYQPLPSSVSTGAVRAAAERRQNREIQNHVKLEKHQTGQPVTLQGDLVKESKPEEESQIMRSKIT